MKKMKQVPQLNPNFIRIGHQVFFSLARVRLSKQPTAQLSDDEIAIFDAIDGRKTLWQLEQIYGPCTASIMAWHSLHLLELVQCKPPKTDAHLVVIEPHMDDAILSVGGSLLKRRFQQPVTLVTVVGQSNYTSYSFEQDFDIDTVSALRLGESKLACRLLDANHITLDELDQPIRWEEGQSSDFSSPQEVTRLADKLARVVTPMNPDEIWIPLALGYHADHHRTRDAAIAMLHRYPERFEQTKIYLYEDVPYANDVAGQNKQALLKHLYGEHKLPESVAQHIDKQIDEKLRLVSIFGSQFKGQMMAPHVIAAAEQAGKNGGLAENLWPFEHLPNPVNALHFERYLDVETLCDTLSEQNELELYLFDWAVPFDIEQLLALFPQLQLTLHVATTERKRLCGFDHNRVVITFHPPGFESLLQLVGNRANTDVPAVITSFDLQWPANLSAIQALEPSFETAQCHFHSCWFSTLIAAITEPT